MRVAILGGGFSGLACAYDASKKHDVTLIEREEGLGGLASGFYAPGWEWPLERAYHHLFTNDSDILSFAKEIDFNGFIYKSPITASLYDMGEFGQKTEGENNYRIFPLDTPQGLLQLPIMSLPARVRTGLVAALFKITPMFPFYENQSAEEFLKKFGGEESWRVFWEPLLRKKFGKHAGEVLASFIWTRINKRSKQLVYIKGGFQTFINHIEECNLKQGVRLRKGHQVLGITKNNGKFRLTITKNNEDRSMVEEYDAVVSTLPTTIMSKVTSELFPSTYLDRFKKLTYMSAVNLILETEQKIHESAYWLSCCVKDFPFLVTLQHTNLIDKKHYGNKHVLYIGNYIDNDNKLLRMDKEQTINYLVPSVQKYSVSKIKITNSFHFKAGFAQPIFNKAFLENKPDFTTPTENFFIANLDMTYPYDRGTNYAVALGRKAASML